LRVKSNRSIIKIRMQRAITCPQCGAALTPHYFARSIVCPYCGSTVRLDEAAVSAAKFRESLRIWNSPNSYLFSSWVSIGDSHWALGRGIARGDTSDVYATQRARWPTELGILKLLRNRQDTELLDNEWNVLQALNQSAARGADIFTTLLPQPIIHGDVAAGPLAGRRSSIFRWESGFYHTFEEVIRVYPHGIPPRASIWVWRRILEMLSFIHASGMAHGAVLPSHLLVQENEHGVRLVGYSCAGQLGDKLRTVWHGYEPFYPEPATSRSTLTVQLDLVMSARCIVAILGGDPANASLPATVPAPLAGIVRRIALAQPDGTANQDAWAIREELKEIAERVFGPPQFIPIVMPA
jgi:predicted RNA-binding Zn-ribbon protein involved in translation (DUF1610 family)